MTIRRLLPADVKEYRSLRLAALKGSSTAFGSSFTEEASRPIAEFKRTLAPAEDRFVFGSFIGKRLVGVVRLVRPTGRKERHKASIYGMYVAPRFRRRGLGTQLLEHALKTARESMQVKRVNLSVVSSNKAALSIYLAFGFEEFGCEPDALRIGGKSYAEKLLTYEL